MSILEPEAGIFYGVCWTVVIARFVSRRLHLGSWKRLEPDDYLILVAMATDTVLMAAMHEVVKTNSNLLPPQDNPSMYSQAEIKSRIFGSKLVLVVEQMQIITIWLLKACLLIMYNRMTHLLPQHKVVIWTAIYVATTFVVMEILYFAVWCRPFKEYFAVPTNSIQCSAATNHLITNAVFNISSDVIILSIPIPLLFKVRLPKKNKLIISMLFMVGLFTIIAAILNKYYSFTHPFGTEWTKWYLRESFTALLCANLPMIYPLIQRIFRLRNWNEQAYNPNSGYRLESHHPATSDSSRGFWAGAKSQPAHKEFGGGLRQAESLDDMEYGRDGQADNTPKFITSAIDQGIMKSVSVSVDSTAESDGKVGNRHVPA